MKRKKCKYEGCNNPVWSGGLCKNHIERKPIRKKRSNFSSKPYKPVPGKKERMIKRHELFLKMWNSKPHKSEVSGTYLGSEPLSTFFHHILPKHKFPLAELDPENIILLTAEEHENVENDMFKYEVVNQKRHNLLKKYNLI